MPSSCYNHYATLPLFYFLFESSSSPIANSPSPVDSASSLFLDLVHFSPVLVIDSVQASSSLLDFTLPAQRSPSSRSVPLGTGAKALPWPEWLDSSHAEVRLWGMFGLRPESPMLPGIRVRAGPPPRSAHQEPSLRKASPSGSWQRHPQWPGAPGSRAAVLNQG